MTDEVVVMPPAALLTKVCSQLTRSSSLLGDVEEATLLHCLELWREHDPDEQWMNNKRDHRNRLIWSGSYHNADNKLSQSLPLCKSERTALAALIQRKFLSTSSGYCHMVPEKRKRIEAPQRSPLEMKYESWCQNLVLRIPKLPEAFAQDPHWRQVLATEELACQQYSALNTTSLVDGLTFLAQYKHLVGVIVVIRSYGLCPTLWIATVVQSFTPSEVHAIFRTLEGQRAREVESWNMQPAGLIVPYVQCLYGSESMRYVKLLAHLEYKRLWRLIYKFNHPITPEIVLTILRHRDKFAPLLKQRIWYLIQAWTGPYTPCLQMQDLLFSNLEAPWSAWDIELLHVLIPLFITPLSLDVIAQMMNFHKKLLPWLVHRWSPSIADSDDWLLSEWSRHYAEYVAQRKTTIVESLKGMHVSDTALQAICGHIF